MRRSSVEDRAAKILAARRDADAPANRAALAAGLADKSAPVVVAAASVIAETELLGFADALKSAFEKRLHSGHRLDPGCRAKIAVVRALLATGEHDAAVYLAGARHVQLEPVWVRIGDPEPEVIGTAWSSLLTLAPAESLAAAIEALDGSNEDEAEAVALARVTALTLLRQERAFDHLIAIVSRGHLEDACDSIRALAPFRHDAKLVKRARAAVAGRREARLRDLFAKSFAGEEAT